MLWILICLGVILSPLLVEGFLLSFRLIRKKEITWKDHLYNILLVLAIAPFIGIILAIIMSLTYTHVDPWNGFALAICYCTALSSLRPYSLWRLIKEKRPLPIGDLVNKGVRLALIVTALVFEMTFFNSSAYRGNNELRELNGNDTSYIMAVQRLTKNDDGSFSGEASSTHAILEYRPIEAPVDSIHFEFEPNNAQIDLSVFYLDANGRWFYDASYHINTSYPEFCTIKLDVANTPYQFHFDVMRTNERCVSTFKLKSVTLNDRVPFTFVPVRFAAEIFVIYLIGIFPKTFFKRKDEKDETNHKRVKLGILAGFVVSVVALLIAALAIPKGDASLLTTYPFKEGSIGSLDPFLQMFDAFKSKQLNLNLVVDQRLVDLGDKAYDYYSRDNVFYYWDRAFYNGKYYSYFGAGPVIFILYPIYYITGYVPTAYFLQIFGIIMVIFGFIYGGIILAEMFSLRIHWPFFIFILISAYIGGLCLDLPVYSHGDLQYRVPIIMGVANAIWFLGFTFTAYHYKKWRIASLALSAFFFVAIVVSRPDLAICVIITIPLYLAMLFEKGTPWKKKIINFAPFLLIMASGATAVMIYNYVRFDSVFEFGTSYQLTVTDIRQVHLGLDDVLPALYHFVFQKPAEKTFYTFPFMVSDYTSKPYDTHVYQAPTIGAMVNPFFYVFLLIPFAFKRKDKLPVILMVALGPLAGIISMTVVYGLGGTCFRYMTVFWPMIGFYALIVILKFCSTSRKLPIGEMFIGLCCIGGILTCLQLVDNYFDGMAGSEYGGLLYVIREFYGAFNFVKPIHP